MIVYIKEAHPSDEWQMKSNEEEGVVYTQPKTMDERLNMAQTFVDQTEIGLPVLVDDISNTANACFAAWPERIYVIGTDGKIAYKGEPGPTGFDPDELDEFLQGYLPEDRRISGLEGSEDAK